MYPDFYEKKIKTTMPISDELMQMAQSSPDVMKVVQDMFQKKYDAEIDKLMVGNGITYQDKGQLTATVGDWYTTSTADSTNWLIGYDPGTASSTVTATFDVSLLQGLQGVTTHYIDNKRRTSLTVDYNRLSAPLKNAMIELLDRAGYDVEQFMYEAGDLQVEAAPREFNKFINASDLLEEFIGYVGSLGVRQGEVMDLPVEHFIKWLIIRAAEQDDEKPTVEMPALPARPVTPKCLGCGKFMQVTTVPYHATCGLAFFKAAVEIEEIIQEVEAVTV